MHNNASPSSSKTILFEGQQVSKANLTQPEGHLSSVMRTHKLRFHLSNLHAILLSCHRLCAEFLARPLLHSHSEVRQFRQ